MRFRFGVALLVALFVMTSASWAGVIPVGNGSFESPACDGVGVSCTPDSWTVVGSANQWAPPTGQYNSIPDGSQVAWANSGGGLEQVLTTDLAANTTYVLTVDVGLRNNVNNTFGGIVDLYAGSTLLGAATGSTPTAGNWTIWTLSVDSATASALVGQPLEIYLGSSTNQTGFDAVSLDATPDAGTVPEPAMFALMGAGLLGLVARRRLAK
jgi:hypothetical protein